MADQTIPQGPGNNVAPSTIIKFKCAATVTKGMAVALSGYTAVAALVVTHGTGTFINGTTIEGADADLVDVCNAIGFACESGVLHGWIDVCVAGICPVGVITDGTVAEGDHIIPTSTAGTVGGTPGTTRDLLGFAVALQIDASTAATYVMVERKYH